MAPTGRLRTRARWNRRCPGGLPPSTRKGVGMRVLGGHLVSRCQERSRAPPDERSTTPRISGRDSSLLSTPIPCQHRSNSCDTWSGALLIMHAGWDLSPTTISGPPLVISNHFRDRVQSGSAGMESPSMSRAHMTMPFGTYERLSARWGRTTSRSRCLYLSRCSILRDERADTGNVTCCRSVLNQVRVGSIEGPDLGVLLRLDLDL